MRKSNLDVKINNRHFLTHNISIVILHKAKKSCRKKVVKIDIAVRLSNVNYVKLLANASRSSITNVKLVNTKEALQYIICKKKITRNKTHRNIFSKSKFSIFFIANNIGCKNGMVIIQC